MKYLHVTGCRRSGTTLLFEMITTCFRHDGRCEHEQSIFDADNGENADSDRHSDGLYLSKKPSDITHMHRIFGSDSQLFVIYVLRDPRAVITSVHPTRSDLYYASFERWQRYERAAASFEGHERFLQVRYEDLVSSPDMIQSTIQEKFPFLHPKFPFKDFHLHAQTSKKAEISLGGLRPISKSSLSNWKQHLPRIRFQLERYPALRSAVERYGYEPDETWLSLLDDVTARIQTYGEQRPNLVKRLETQIRYFIKSQLYLRRRSSH